MTLEIVEFKCPTCGQLIGEEEYRRACNALDKKVQELCEGKIREQEEKHRQEMLEQQEKNNRELEIRVGQKVEEKMRAEKALLTEKHQKEIEMKNKEIEAAKRQSTEYIDETVEQAIRHKEEKHRQKEAEYQLQISRLIDRVENLQQTLEKVPPELRGTAGEIVLYDELHKAFPQDDLNSKIVGKEMPDVVQRIVIDSGERLSTPILWDMKTGENVTSHDIAKANRYKENYNTDYCILVTAKGITSRDSKNYGSHLIGKREEILLVHPTIAVGVAELTRKFVIEKTKLMKNNDGRASKQMKLYDYITSSARIRKMQEVIEKKRKLDELQRKEETYVQKMWNERKGIVQEWFEIDRNDQDTINAITQKEAQANEQEKDEDVSTKDKEQNEDK
jgi:hypothetical protein